MVASDATVRLGPVRPALVYLNSPANPHGRILGADHLRKMIAWARERGALLVSDECYLEYAWEGEPSSVLHPDINGGSLEGVLAVHSLSKRSNMAGYRGAFVGRRRSGGRASCWRCASTSASWCPLRCRRR